MSTGALKVKNTKKLGKNTDQKQHVRWICVVYHRTNKVLLHNLFVLCFRNAKTTWNIFIFNAFRFSYRPIRTHCILRVRFLPMSSKKMAWKSQMFLQICLIVFPLFVTRSELAEWITPSITVIHGNPKYPPLKAAPSIIIFTIGCMKGQRWINPCFTLVGS